MENTDKLEALLELNRRTDDKVALRLETLLFDAQLAADTTKKDLLGMADSISHTMDNIRKTVEAGYNVNSLGELQGTGPRLDVLCSDYYHAKLTLEGTLRMVDEYLDAKVEDGSFAE